MPADRPEPLRVQRPEQGTYVVVLSPELSLRVVVVDGTTRASLWMGGKQLGEEKTAAQA